MAHDTPAQIINTAHIWPTPSTARVTEYIATRPVLSYTISTEYSRGGIAVSFTKLAASTEDATATVTLNRAQQLLIQPDLLVSRIGTPTRIFDQDAYIDAQYQLLKERAPALPLASYNASMDTYFHNAAFKRWCMLTHNWAASTNLATADGDHACQEIENIAGLPIKSTIRNEKTGLLITTQTTFSSKLSTSDLATRLHDQLGVFFAVENQPTPTAADVHIDIQHAKTTRYDRKGRPYQITLWAHGSANTGNQSEGMEKTRHFNIVWQ